MNLTKKIKRSLITVASLLATVGIGVLVSGQPTSANQLTFSVTPVLPDNQVDKTDGFFNLKLGAGESEDLTLRYQNNTKRPVTVTTKVAPASTNNNGVVEYGLNKIKADTTRQFNMQDLVNVPEKVDLAAGETKEVPVHVSMPNQAYAGIIAGGLTFSDETQNQQNMDVKSKGMAIKNIYSFQLGLLMRQSKDAAYSDDQIQQSGLKMHEVKPTQINYRNVVTANLQNPLNVYVNQMAVVAKISKVGSSQIIYQSKKDNMQMAPNTNFDYPIALGAGEAMKPGKYKLDLMAYSEKNPKGKFTTADFNTKGADTYTYMWHFTKTFEIKADAAKHFNQKDVTIQPFNWGLLFIVLALLLLLLALFLWLFVFKRRKDEAEVDIEEIVHDHNGQELPIIRTTTMKEYKRLVKKGKQVRIVER